ncbi:hypothetical protein QTO01_11630 [Vibrio mytili]|uniref:Uncharacterized protein n=1 Tax=Vibrio mytili TaxID=50718 RepID=A0A0C3E7R7_9VIBR|nr:hypothetical protein [Vibrio mytili]KIN10448.1 hypothetical protein SU60_12500 [Vibrio mytili]
MKLIKMAGVVAALVVGFYTPTLLKNFSSSSTLKPLDEYCFLSTSPCEQQGVSMMLDVEVPQPLVPAQLTVDWEDSQAEQLILTLAGREMDMGQPKYILKQVSPGKYQGELLLPVCIQDSMTWVGELTDGQSTLYPALKMHR